MSTSIVNSSFYSIFIMQMSLGNLIEKLTGCLFLLYFYQFLYVFSDTFEKQTMAFYFHAKIFCCGDVFDSLSIFKFCIEYKLIYAHVAAASVRVTSLDKSTIWLCYHWRFLLYIIYIPKWKVDIGIGKNEKSVFFSIFFYDVDSIKVSKLNVLTSVGIYTIWRFQW
jgi:hypothetical protein